MSSRSVSVSNCARIIAETCANVQARERVLVVSDFYQLRSIPESIVAANHALDAEVISVNIFTTHTFIEIPERLKTLMKQSDVVFMCTYRGFPIWRDRSLLEEILESGCRYLQMHMLTEDLMLRVVPVEYNQIKKRIALLSKLLPSAERVEITSPVGTNLTFSCKGRRISLAWDGLCRNHGDYDAIPGGLITISVVEGTASGIVVLNGSMDYTSLSLDDDFSRRSGRIWEPIRLTVEGGRVVKIEGGWMAEALRRRMATADKNGVNFGQFGIGLNPKCKMTGYMLEDERYAGSIIILLGRNKYAYGDTKSNFIAPFNLLNGTLKLDGRTIVENGCLRI